MEADCELRRYDHLRASAGHGFLNQTAMPGRPQPGRHGGDTGDTAAVNPRPTVRSVRGLARRPAQATTQDQGDLIPHMAPSRPRAGRSKEPRPGLFTALRLGGRRSWLLVAAVLIFV